ncbi:MAG: ParB/RepB/Spo0J family partition protein [Acidobacteriota bacterium]
MAKKDIKRDSGGLFNLFSWAVGWGNGKDEQLLLLPLDDIVVDRRQPRRHFSRESLAQLAQSIRANGVIEPVLVHKLADGNYQLIAGERRWRAARLAGHSEIPAIVSSLVHESDIKKFQLIENLLREDLNPIEEIYAYLDLLAARLANNAQHKQVLAAALPARRIKLAELLRQLDKRMRTRSALTPVEVELAQTVATVFDEIGQTKWQEFVTKRLPALNLPPELLTALSEGWLSYQQARMIAEIKDRTFGTQRAHTERQKMLTWIKRSAPTPIQLRERIRQLRAEKLTKPTTPTQLLPARLNQLAKQLRALKRTPQDLPQELQERLESSLSDLEAIIAQYTQTEQS